VPFSILHFSDLHLDAAFSGSRLPVHVARLCRDQLRQALRNLIDLAKSRQADAVTIAGDLYERDRLGPDTAAFLAHELERLTPIPVFIAPGNHDAADASSLYQRGCWPDNVNIAFSNELSEWRLSDDYSLWSASHLTPSDRQNFLHDFHLPDRQADGNRRHVPLLLLHASIKSSGAEDDHSHAPVTLDEIRQAGFALALLGHYHSFKHLRENHLTAVYPGSPVPLGFQEDGNHGAVWITLKDNTQPTVEFIPLPGLRFATIEVPADGCEHRDQLIDRIIAVAQEKNLQQAFVRLRLTGVALASLQLDLEVMANRLSDHFGYVRLENETRPAKDLRQLAAEPTVRGAFVRDLLEWIEREPDKRSLYAEALSYGLQAFEQDDIALR